MMSMYLAKLCYRVYRVNHTNHNGTSISLAKGVFRAQNGIRKLSFGMNMSWLEMNKVNLVIHRYDQKG